MKFTPLNLDSVKKVLLLKKKQVEQDIKNVEKEDPVTNQVLAEASEPGTDSWMADIHARAISSRETLKKLLSDITNSIKDIKLGKFGKCRKCGKPIEQERLKAIPTAKECISCSRKK